MNTRDKLAAAVTAYDRKQSAKRHYNPYALGIYLERVNAVCADIERGASVREAIMRGFNDRLLSHVLKAVGERDFTSDEMAAFSVCYSPVTK